jgi:hypothetical protein
MAELCADQLAAVEPQLAEMAAEFLEVLVVQVALQGVQQCDEAIGGEPAGVVVGDLAQLPEPGDQDFELAHGAGQDGCGPLGGPESPHVTLVLQGAHGDAVHLPDDLRRGDAVGEDVLPVADRVGVGEAGEQHPHRDVVQELVPGRHRLQHGAKLQVLDQVVAVRRQVGGDVEVPVTVEQVGLHEPSLSLSWS